MILKKESKNDFYEFGNLVSFTTQQSKFACRTMFLFVQFFFFFFCFCFCWSPFDSSQSFRQQSFSRFQLDKQQFRKVEKIVFGAKKNGKRIGIILIVGIRRVVCWKIWREKNDEKDLGDNWLRQPVIRKT